MIATIALIGTSGAGKSTVGPLLAARLGVPFVDVDAEVERVAGRPIREIFASDGEAAFRASERDLTLAALAAPGVVSLGGGAPMTPAVAEGLAGHHVVWLRVSPEVAAARVGVDRLRPLLGADTLATLRRMLAERGGVYAALATATIDTDALDPAGAAEAVLGALSEPEGES